MRRRLRPLVRDEDVALVGYRVLDDNDHFLGEHIRSTAITVVDLTEVRETGTGRALGKALANLTKPDLKGFREDFARINAARYTA